MLAEIVNDESLRTAIMDELAPLISPECKPKLSPGELATQLQHCEILNSVYNETLRLKASSTSVRYVMEDTQLGRFKLRKGRQMVIPYRQQMLNESTFGKDYASFNSQRFLNDPGLVKNPHYRPFGGGATLCPGKALAQKEVLTFVALALGKFQAQLSVRKEPGKSSVPRMNTWTPCIGIMGPVGEKLCVTITKPKW
jgi:cytochrome P450